MKYTKFGGNELPDKVIELDDNSFDDTVNKSDKLIIVEFYTTTCPNFRAIAPVYSNYFWNYNKIHGMIVT